MEQLEKEMVDDTDLPQGETAYDRLYQVIRDGSLGPGDRVREADIAKRFGLSRTPVREAIRRLESDGIIEHRARTGAVVRSLGHAEVIELYEMRLVLERTAAELAARHVSDAEIDEIEDLNAAIKAADANGQDVAGLNANFHRCLCLASRNRFLLSAIRTMNNAMMLLGPTTMDGAGRICEAVDQHDLIIEALRQRDADKAGGAAKQHLETSLRHRLRIMRKT